MTKVVVFDFDGVIVPSEEIKQNGYRWMFSDYGEIVPEEAIHAAREEFSGARGNRYDVIRSVLARTGVTEDIETQTRIYAERFSTIVRERINALRVASEVRAMLERLSTRHALYINSNNPDEPLRETVESLGITHFFKDILGSSRSKLKNLQEIAVREGITPSEMVFIGDGEGDLSAAKQFGCEFIGIATGLNGWQDGASEFRILGSVAELKIDGGDRRGERMV